MTTFIICDSSQNVPQSYLDSLPILEVPASVIFGDEVYLKGEISSAEFYHRLESLPRGASLPTTSQPTPGQFTVALGTAKERGATDVLITSVSSKLSGTYNSAFQAAAQEQDIPVEVWNSETASMAAGWQTIAAAEMAMAGASLREVVEAMPQIQARTYAAFTVDTLQYLVAGGRLSPIQGMMGTLLQVKPMLTVLDGLLQPVGRVRGRKRSKHELIKMLQAHFGQNPLRVAVVNANVAEEATAFAGELQDALNVVEVLVEELGPVLAALGGPGFLALAVLQVIEP